MNPHILFLLLNDGEVLRWLGAVDKFERIGNDGRITSMAAAGGALFLQLNDGEVLRWLGAVDKFERIGNDGRITSMAAAGGALFLLLNDGEVLRWLGAVDKFERIGNDGRITSMAAAGSALFLLLNDGEVLRWLGAVDKFERMGNDKRITSMAAAGSALFLQLNDGEVLRWLGAVDKFERIGNDKRITSMAAAGSALFLQLNDGLVLRWLGAVDKFERIGNDKRITSMAAAGSALFLQLNDGLVLRWLGAVDKFERIGNDKRITSMAADVDIAHAIERVTETYNRIGGFASPLGMPVDAALEPRQTPLVSEENGNGVSKFRGGTITIKDFDFDQPPVISHEKQVLVFLAALECRIKQESEDEIVGSVGVIKPSTHTSDTHHFPQTDFLKFGPVGERIALTQILVYSGAPADLLLVCALIEHDSGDIEKYKQQLADLISQAAKAGSAEVGVPSELSNADTGIIGSISLGLSNAIFGAFGADDDPYNSQILRIPARDLLSGKKPIFKTQTLKRDDDPRTADFTHSMILSGTDQGGDTGEFGFYFKVEVNDVDTTFP